ncbi:MAG: DUF1854 domain-containing protein [Chthonomonas sp.]|nr:DUF1854 domain-containing protein [Chthonomonas sp.]
MKQPKTLNLFYHPEDRLRLTIEDRSYPTVKPVWASPLTHPNRFLAMLDGKDQEIATVADPESLTPESLAAVREELRRRYLTATIYRVVDAKGEWGATYWTVETDRGVREFITQSLQENVQWLEENHLLLTDVDGNKFELPDVSKMDERSRTIIAGIL